MLRSTLSTLRCMKVVYFTPLLGTPLNLTPRLLPLARLKSSTTITIARKQDSFFRKLIRKIGFLDTSRSRLKASGFMIYERCADGSDFTQFIKELSMPDTMFTWFLVTELHCWMIMTRVMAEGEEGRVMRNGLVEALWQDVGMRMRKLEAPHVGQTMQDLSQQFRAALIGYDEGVQGSDTVLAAALWRRMLNRDKDVTPEQLETLVSYVRRQIAALDKIPTEQFLKKPKITWLPLKASS